MRKFLHEGTANVDTPILKGASYYMPQMPQQRKTMLI